MSTEKAAPYIRRRAYSKIHVTSWVIYLEKDGYVRCSFKNCNFMGFDVEEMCNHYGFCTGDNSTAKYVCDYCKGCTDNKKKLELHLARAHNVIIPNVDLEPKPICRSTEPERTKPSRVLLQSWSYFFEQYNYIKCSVCDYLANTLSEMCRHYTVCRKEKELLMYICSECKGRTISVNPLLWHLERSHKIFKAPNQFNHITNTMVRHWERELVEKGYVSCLHITKGQRDCFYFDHRVLGIVEHAQCCKGPQFTTAKERCPHCRMWTATKEMLKIHIEITHNSENKAEPSDVVLLPQVAVKEEILEETTRKLEEKTKTVQLKKDEKIVGKDKCCSVFTTKKSNVGSLISLKNNASGSKVSAKDNQLFMESPSCSTDFFGLQEVEDIRNIEGNKIEPDVCQSKSHSTGLEVLNEAKLKKVEVCAKVIDFGENILTIKNSSKQKESVVIPEEFPPNINHPRTGLEMGSKVKKTDRLDKTEVKENDKYLAMPTCSHENSIPISILKDWAEDNENDSSEGRDSDKGVSGRKNVVGDTEENEPLNNVVNMKELNNKRRKDEAAKKDNLKRSQRKQPCLFEDELLSDDNNSNLSEECFDEDEVKLDLSDDNQESSTFSRLPLKNYLKRRGASDSARNSPMKHLSTSMESIPVKKHIEVAGTKNCHGVSNKDITNAEETISSSQIKPDTSNQIKQIKSTSNKSFKSDVKLFPESFVNINFDTVIDETSRSSEKNDKLMLSQINILSGDFPVPAFSSNIVVHEESNCTVDKTDKNNKITKSSLTGFSEFKCDDKIIESILVNVTPEKLLSNKTSSSKKESLESLHPSNSGTREDSVLIKGMNLNRQEKIYIEKNGRDSSESLVSFISKGNLNKSYFKDCIMRANFIEQCARTSPSKNELDLTECETECAVEKEFNSHNSSHNDKDTYNKINTNFQNTAFPFTEDIPRRVSSGCSDDSMDEDFLGTDEEPDMRLKSFNGFQEISEESWCHRRRFQQFLNRLSESETEEWYINAGSLSMEVKKEEKLVCSKSNSKARLKSCKVNNKLKGCIATTKSESNSSGSEFIELFQSEIDDSSIKNIDNIFKECPKERCKYDNNIGKSRVNEEKVKEQSELSTSNTSLNNITEQNLTNNTKISYSVDLKENSVNEKRPPLIYDDPVNVIKKKQNSHDLSNAVTYETTSTLVKCNSKLNCNNFHPKDNSNYLDMNKKSGDETAFATLSKFKEFTVMTTHITEEKIEDKSMQALVNVKCTELNESTVIQETDKNVSSDKLPSRICNEQLNNNEENTEVFEDRSGNTLSKYIPKSHSSKETTISNEDEEVNTDYHEIEQDASKELNSKNVFKVEENKKQNDNVESGIIGFSCFTPKMDPVPKMVTGELSVKVTYEDMNENNKETTLFTKTFFGDSVGTPSFKEENISTKEILSNCNEKGKLITDTLINNNVFNTCNLTRDVYSNVTNVREDNNASGSHSPSTSLLPKKRGRPPKIKYNETLDLLGIKKEKVGNANKTTDVKDIEYSDMLLKKISGVSKEHCKDELLISIFSDDILKIFQIDTNKNQVIKGGLSFPHSHDSSSGLSDAVRKKMTYPRECDTYMPKRKRGRPPKIKVPLNENHSGLENHINMEQFYYSPVANGGPAVETESKAVSDYKCHTDKSTASGLESSEDSAKSLPNNTVLPKKRGRPSKSNTDLNISKIQKKEYIDKHIHDKVIVSPEKKKRGRPPKLKKRGRPRKTNNCKRLRSISESSFAASNIKDLMRIAGNITNDNESILRSPALKTEQNSLEIIAEPGKLESKTINLSGSNCYVDNSSMCSTVKKKRGRPRKTNSDESVSEEPEPCVMKSNENCLEDCKIPNSDNYLLSQGTIQRRRGRPPKLNTSQNCNTVSEESSPQKRKRFKNKLIFDDFETEDNDSNEGHGSQLLGTDLILINDAKTISNLAKQKLKPKSDVTKQCDNRPRPAEDSIFIAKHKGTDRVVCGVCKQEMTYQKYRTHHSIYQHFALCWLEGEEPPVDMNNEKEVLKRLWYTKKRVKKVIFRCSNCNLPKLSAVGFQSHIKFCGKKNEEKESLLWTCEICGARMMPSSMRPHLYIKHNSGTGTAHSSTIDATFIIPKSKRAAASRAVEVIQSHAEEANKEADDTSRRRSVSPNSKPLMARLYMKPNNIIPSDLYRKCQVALKENMVFQCQYEGCSHKVDTTPAFRKHYLTCPFGPDRVYKCRPCSFTSKTEREMLKHVEDNHESMIQSHNWEESDKSDDSDGESRPNSYNPSQHFKFLQQKVKFRGGTKKYYFTDALKWTLDLREKNLAKDMLFSEVQVGSSTWQPLCMNIATSYLPTLQNSIQFRGNDKTWHTLRRFEGTLVDGVPVIFAGGPVWALSWAPVPDSGNHHQFLALATHPKMELTHEMSTVYKYKSIIQIWCFGHLNNCEPISGETPKFLMGLAHSHGAVWALRWCPAGCHSDSRLGLLAAACSDGSISIYSVPRFRYTFESVSQYTIYDVKPVVELKLGCEMLSQAVSLDWHSVKPHNIIAGGFTNGMVALWDVTTSSSLLKDGNVIYPYKVIEAHYSAVTAVSLSPTKEGITLMTGSLDRATKFWRLDDTTAPVNTIRKASVTDAVMPKNWMTSISGYDDVYSLNSLHITGYNYRETYTVGNTNYLLQSGTVWSIAFNDWLNACACASELGKVTVFFRKQILVTEDSKKVKNNSMIGDIVNYSVQPLDSSRKAEELGPMYSDCVSKVGLDICFMEDLIETSRPSSASSSETMDCYPLLSINKVAWNPNMSSFTWMAVGMQCGLVMAPRTKCENFDLGELLKNNMER